MYGNVGLATPRGSGTSGYVQKNRAFMRPRDDNFGRNGFADSASAGTGSNSTRMREPDQGILDHHRKRAIEVRVFELRDQLEEAGELGDDEIDQRCDELRERLTKEGAAKTSAAAAAAVTSTSGGANGRRQFKAHQVHEQAAAKAVESERLRQALGISKDYQEGAHWRRQDEKMALKRKQMEEGEEEEEGGRGRGRPGKRQERKSSDDDNDDDNGSVRPIKKSVEEENGGAGRARGRGRRSGSGSDDEDAGDAGADDVKRPRQQRPRSYSRSEDSRSPSRSLSGSRSLSRSRSRSQSRAPRRRPIRSQSRSRSRSPRHNLSRSRSPRSSRSRSGSR